MMAVLILSEDEITGVGHARELVDRVSVLFASDKPKVIGPSAASVGKINDIYRHVFYVKHNDYQILVNVKDELESYINSEQWNKDSVQFDFNPINAY